MKIERIEDVSDPVIGRVYYIPAVEVHGPDQFAYRGKFVPVMGPLHEDADIIGFKPMHWHIDFRFVPPSRTKPCRNLFGKVLLSSKAAGPVTRIRRSLKQFMPDWPGRNYPDEVAKPLRAPWIRNLEAAYADAQLGDCRTCPHRGLRLQGLPVVEGLVTCPGHGLRWNVETRKLVPHAPR